MLADIKEHSSYTLPQINAGHSAIENTALVRFGQGVKNELIAPFPNISQICD